MAKFYVKCAICDLIYETDTLPVDCVCGGKYIMQTVVNQEDCFYRGRKQD